jgi:hypothetical protein
MKNIFTQSTARQNSCRNSTSPAIAHGRGVDNGCCSCQAERVLVVRFSLMREPPKRAPRPCPRSGCSLLSAIALTLTELRCTGFGDDALFKRRVTQRGRFNCARTTADSLRQGRPLRHQATTQNAPSFKPACRSNYNLPISFWQDRASDTGPRTRVGPSRRFKRARCPDPICRSYHRSARGSGGRIRPARRKRL